MANNPYLCYNYLRGCKGFDLEMKYEWHAEDVGWPPKSSDKFLNDNNENLSLAA